MLFVDCGQHGAHKAHVVAKLCRVERGVDAERQEPRERARGEQRRVEAKPPRILGKGLAVDAKYGHEHARHVGGHAVEERHVELGKDEAVNVRERLGQAHEAVDAQRAVGGREAQRLDPR